MINSYQLKVVLTADMVRRTINEMSAKEKSDKEPMNTNEDGKTDE